MGVRLSLPVRDRHYIMIRYIKSCYDELKNKVSWPTLTQLQSSSLVVAICSVFIAIIIYVMDTASNNLIDLFFQWFGNKES